MREMDEKITMKSSKVIKEDMEAEMQTRKEVEREEVKEIEMILDVEDMMRTEHMMNTVTENMTRAMKKIEIGMCMKTDTEAVGEVLPIDMVAAEGNEEVARRLRAIGSLL